MSAISDEYRKFLGDMKRSGLKVEDVPEELLTGMLELHQHALLEWMREHQPENFQKIFREKCGDSSRTER